MHKFIVSFFPVGRYSIYSRALFY